MHLCQRLRGTVCVCVCVRVCVYGVYVYVIRTSALEGHSGVIDCKATGSHPCRVCVWQQCVSRVSVCHSLRAPSVCVFMNPIARESLDFFLLVRFELGDSVVILV